MTIKRTKSAILNDINSTLCPELKAVTNLFRGNITQSKINKAVESLNKVKENEYVITFDNYGMFLKYYIELRSLPIKQNKTMIEILRCLLYYVQDSRYYTIYNLIRAIKKLDTV